MSKCKTLRIDTLTIHYFIRFKSCNIIFQSQITLDGTSYKIIYLNELPIELAIIYTKVIY